MLIIYHLIIINLKVVELGSIMIVGPLLARFGKGFIPRPGGDKIGRRRVDTHFVGFKKLGAKFEYDNKEEFYRVTAEKLIGTYMLLDESFCNWNLANIIMTFCNGQKEKLQYILASEPYLQQLYK